VKNSERKITIFKYDVTRPQQYILVAVCFLLLFFVTGGVAGIMWALGKTAFHDTNNRRL
jgi:hypothetical protein